jgi:hypothetical protein
VQVPSNGWQRAVGIAQSASAAQLAGGAPLVPAPPSAPTGAGSNSDTVASQLPAPATETKPTSREIARVGRRRQRCSGLISAAARSNIVRARIGRVVGPTATSRMRPLVRSRQSRERP